MNFFVLNVCSILKVLGFSVRIVVSPCGVYFIILSVLQLLQLEFVPR